MPATMFDIPLFHRRSDIVSTLLSTLEQREAAVAEREADVVRRERAIEHEERLHELRGFGRPFASSAPADVNATIRPFEPMPRLRFQDTFRLREIDWWTKQLGSVPILA